MERGDFDPYYKWLGIAPKDQPPNHYRLLGIDLFEADPDVISHAADQRMAHVRSFQTGRNAAESQSILNQIAAARVCLLNPAKKAEYDAALRRSIAAAEPQPVSEPPPRREPPLGASPLVFPGPGRARPWSGRKRKVVLLVATFAGIVVLAAVLVAVRKPGAPESPVAPMKPGPENAAIAAVRRPAPSAPQSGAAVRQLPATDLLAAIDVGRDRVRGDWRKEGGALIAPPVPAAALAVPGAVPSEYTLTLAAERLSGNDSLTVGLVVGGRQVAVVLEGWGNRASGLALVRGQRELKSMEAVFKPGAASTIVCTVRKSRIQIACEGSPLMDWSGDPADLSLIARYWTGVPPDRLFLGAWESSFCISRLEVVPLTE